MTAEAEQNATRLAHESIAAGDPTGWFERLYAAAADGLTAVPWDRRAPSPLLVQWAAASERAERQPSATRPDGPTATKTETALVVGCGLGDDAEFIASLGFRTVAFDISAERHPGRARAVPALWRHVLRGRPDGPAHRLAARL